MPTRLSAPVLALIAAACSTSTHATRPAAIGTPRRAADLLAVIDRPGPIEAETVASADWEVPLSGLLNLDHERSRAAGLEDRAEPIQIYFHALRHPQRGLFVIDTGVERALRDAPGEAAIQGVVASFMHLEKMTFRAPLGDWLARQPAPLAGVLMTHLHLDHVSGMRDVPRGTPIFAGPGETSPVSLQNLVVRGNIDRALDGQEPIGEWAFAADPDGRFAGLVDVFGDGSLWAIQTPGHTPGSTAYLARTPRGPVLYTGDTCHTAWGWAHAVEPGDFTADHPANAEALGVLRTLAADHPAMEVHLGHQPTTSAQAALGR